MPQRRPSNPPTRSTIPAWTMLPFGTTASETRVSHSLRGLRTSLGATEQPTSKTLTDTSSPYAARYHQRSRPNRKHIRLGTCRFTEHEFLDPDDPHISMI